MDDRSRRCVTPGVTHLRVNSRQLLNGTPASEQVDERYYQRDHQQRMNDVPADIEAPSKEPEDEEYGKNGPKHNGSPEPQGNGFC